MTINHQFKYIYLCGTFYSLIVESQWSGWNDEGSCAPKPTAFCSRDCTVDGLINQSRMCEYATSAPHMPCFGDDDEDGRDHQSVPCVTQCSAGIYTMWESWTGAWEVGYMDRRMEYRERFCSCVDTCGERNTFREERSSELVDTRGSYENCGDALLANNDVHGFYIIKADPSDHSFGVLKIECIHSNRIVHLTNAESFLTVAGPEYSESTLYRSFHYKMSASLGFVSVLRWARTRGNGCSCTQSLTRTCLSPSSGYLYFQDATRQELSCPNTALNVPISDVALLSESSSMLSKLPFEAIELGLVGMGGYIIVNVSNLICSCIA